jgi:hypothetical protein
MQQKIYLLLKVADSGITCQKNCVQLNTGGLLGLLENFWCLSAIVEKKFAFHQNFS